MPSLKPKWTDRETHLLCNCADCGRVLLGTSMQDVVPPGATPPYPFVAARVPAGPRNPPYCGDCLGRVPAVPAGSYGPTEVPE